MYDLKLLLQKLRDDGYVIKDIHDKYQFTPKFYEELDGKVPGKSLLPVHSPNTALQVKNFTKMGKDQWEFLFMKFITDAQVPQRLEDGKGNAYYANKFSQDGLKVFKKALESGVQYDVLVKSTMLYYKGSVRFKKAIGNYIKDGDWRTDYEALVNAASTGEESLMKHITDQTQHNGSAGFTLG